MIRLPNDLGMGRGAVFFVVASMPVLDRLLFALGLTLRPLCHPVVKPYDPV